MNRQHVTPIPGNSCARTKAQERAAARQSMSDRARRLKSRATAYVAASASEQVCGGESLPVYHGASGHVDLYH
jgi:hypothetical protein